jgi:signal transduction histidine kinase
MGSGALERMPMLKWILMRNSTEQDLPGHEMMRLSHRAGMAEMASGVLHNVGNVLNSVATSAAMMREKLDNGKFVSLVMVTAMIQENRADIGNFFLSDLRGKKVPDLLSRLAELMCEDRDAMYRNIAHLEAGVEHIKQIIQSQQSMARGTRHVAEEDMGTVIDEAIQLSGLAKNTHGVTLVRKLSPCPRMRIEKHKVLQILINLLTNAEKAVVDNNNDLKQITVSLGIVAAEPDLRIAISVEDTGVGISPDYIPMIFQHGFTTRNDGHGFGLHTAAIDSTNMGGSLTVSSPGIGQGAAFTLEIRDAAMEFLHHA